MTVETTKKKEVKISSETKSCFTIMPFGGWHDSYYLDIYLPAIEEVGFIAQRADDLFRPGTIINDIWEYTKGAEIILADLTGKNPNVFYELGLAHAIAKPAILVTEKMDDVPFDLRALRILEYDRNEPDWGAVLKRNIVRSIKEITASPLKAVMPTFLSEYNDTGVSVSSEDKELLSIQRDIEVLRNELADLRYNLADSPSPMPSPTRKVNTDDLTGTKVLAEYVRRHFDTHGSAIETKRHLTDGLHMTSSEAEEIMKIAFNEGNKKQS